MMKSILIKVAFGTDKNMLKESTKMFSELNAIKQFHSLGGFIKTPDISNAIGTIPISSQPRWHETCI